MKLYHYGARPFAFDASRTYEQPEMHFKPVGLWLSVDDDWKRWCDGEEFNHEGLVHRAELAFAKGANILRIEGPEAIDRFTKKYRLSGTPTLDALRAIDWARVVEEYDGIMIAPYVWERRLTPHTFWYYCWDCASACVWNLRAVGVIGSAVTA